MNFHAVAPDAGRNAHCTCGDEFSLATNLVRHVETSNAAMIAALGDNEDFGGFGYIGGRLHLTDGQRRKADAMLVEYVLRRGVSAARVFEWANSRSGRFYADEWAGGDGFGRAASLLPFS